MQKQEKGRKEEAEGQGRAQKRQEEVQPSPGFHRDAKTEESAEEVHFGSLCTGYHMKHFR